MNTIDSNDDLLDAPDRRRQDEEDSEDVELDGIEEELNEDLD